jgi:hypothetical protein
LLSNPTAWCQPQAERFRYGARRRVLEFLYIDADASRSLFAPGSCCGDTTDKQVGSIDRNDGISASYSSTTRTSLQHLQHQQGLRVRRPVHPTAGSSSCMYVTAFRQPLIRVACAASITAIQDGRPGVHQAALSLTDPGTYRELRRRGADRLTLYLGPHTPGLCPHAGTAMVVLHARGAQWQAPCHCACVQLAHETMLL